VEITAASSGRCEMAACKDGKLGAKEPSVVHVWRSPKAVLRSGDAQVV